MRLKSILVNALVLTLLLIVTGCFSSRPEDIQAFSFPAQTLVTTDNYILHPPDAIEVFCSKVPELHNQRQQIRPDGKVSFEGLGDVQAAGKTPAQLAEVLRKKVSSLYSLPGQNPIDVRVAAYHSGFYYVLGEVSFPGPKVSTGRDTALTALAGARPTVLAWLEKVQVIRPSADENIRPKVFALNYKKMIAHGDTTKNVLLQDGDIVYVPPTILAAIAMKVEEFVRPIGRAFSTVNIVQRATVTGGGYGY